jgi:hypothetical protein
VNGTDPDILRMIEIFGTDSIDEIEALLAIMNEATE